MKLHFFLSKTQHLDSVNQSNRSGIHWSFFLLIHILFSKIFHKLKAICVLEETTSLWINGSRTVPSFSLIIYVPPNSVHFSPSLLSVPPCRSWFNVTIIFVKHSIPLTYTKFKSHVSSTPRRNEVLRAASMVLLAEGPLLPSPGAGAPQEHGPTCLLQRCPETRATDGRAYRRRLQGLNTAVPRVPCERQGFLKQCTTCKRKIPALHWDLYFEEKNSVEVKTHIMHVHIRIELRLYITLTFSLTSFFLQHL